MPPEPQRIGIKPTITDYGIARLFVLRHCSSDATDETVETLVAVLREVYASGFEAGKMHREFADAGAHSRALTFVE